MATSIILGAALFEVPKILMVHDASITVLAVASDLTAGAIACLSVAVLMRYFHRHGGAALNPCAYVCWLAGTIFLSLRVIGR